MSEKDAPITPEFLAPEAPAAATPTEPETQAPAAESSEPELDPRVRKVIDDIRGDFKAERARRQAAEKAMEDFKQSIGKAFGLIEDEPVDPAKLTEQLTASQKQAKRAALELAVYRSAPDAEVANFLLDSRTFEAKVENLDPTDAEAITAAVNEAVTQNPALGKRLPAPNPAQGTSSGGPTSVSQLTEADLKSMTPDQIVTAQNEGRLNTLLGRR